MLSAVPAVLRRREAAVAMFRRPLRAPSDPLLMELHVLDPVQREDVAFAVALLWESFLERFGSADLRSPEGASARGEHIAELRQSAEFIRRSDEQHRHYHVAPALMARYLHALLSPEGIKDAGGVGDTVISLIEEGRRARHQGRKKLFRKAG